MRRIYSLAFLILLLPLLGSSCKEEPPVTPPPPPVIHTHTMVPISIEFKDVPMILVVHTYEQLRDPQYIDTTIETVLDSLYTMPTTSAGCTECLIGGGKVILKDTVYFRTVGQKPFSIQDATIEADTAQHIIKNFLFTEFYTNNGRHTVDAKTIKITAQDLPYIIDGNKTVIELKGDAIKQIILERSREIKTESSPKGSERYESFTDYSSDLENASIVITMTKQ